MPNPEDAPTQSNPTLAELFRAFFGISVVGFGGVLPWARRMLVEKRGWLNGEEFTEVLSLGQFLPGGNIINVAVVVGERFRGVLGSIVAVIGLLAAPCAAIVIAGSLYLKYAGVAAVHDGLGGVASAAVGLILAMAWKMADPLVRKRAFVPLALAGATFAAVGLFRVWLPLAVLVIAPLGVAYAWWRRAR